MLEAKSKKCQQQYLVCVSKQIWGRERERDRKKQRKKERKKRERE
jgi:hypothetical protein